LKKQEQINGGPDGVRAAMEVTHVLRNNFICEALNTFRACCFYSKNVPK
jgi:hypothetical protein